MAGNEVIVVTKDDVVFHMNVNNVSKMTELSELSGKDVIKIVAGESHVCALTSSGDVYVWGENSCGQLGTGPESKHSSEKPVKLDLDLNNEKVVDIECGQCYTLVVTNAGQVYGWGCSRKLGNGDIDGQSPPIKVMGLEGQHLSGIACGYHHSVAVTDSGRVGYNQSNQLGLGHKTDQLIPVQNPYFNDIKVNKVVTGNHHTLLLSADGNVYAFGSNDYAQLGTGSFDEQGTPYNPLIKHGPFVDIVAQKFNNISAAVTANGGHFVWGKCRKPLGTLLSPTVVTGVDSIHDIIGLYAKTPATYYSIDVSDGVDHPVLEALNS
ncbi:unnamed protein product [Medioppia subpectinata]|uniref:RCC1-like domain-containing protein n=1 Tax=Medioppia subpectinata TaxID=1979941 RepID=A0A7R9KCI6_9ACAR|nr:unnamed protein product [Medioppia subpectinata]CAG2100696.1 unnamed protein product [Medioppia subpectinata]